MGWTYNDRQSYSGALRRAVTEMQRAETISTHAGDEGASEDIVQINREIMRLYEENAKAEASRSPAAPRKTRARRKT